MCNEARHAPDGFRKITLGDFMVIALSDGLFDLPAEELLVEDRPGVVRALLEQARLPSTVSSTVNGYLIDTGSRRILVDAGAGDLQGPGLGQLTHNLRAAGYAPETIDEVLLTHLHPDHVGGIVSQGRAVFPNAVIRVDAEEAAFWQDASHIGKVDASVSASFEGARAALQPYLASGHVRTFNAGAQLASGVMSVAMGGHTVGHTGYRIQSRGQTLMICGDVLHVAAVQFADPKVTIRYDGEPAQAHLTREHLFAEAAREGYWLAAAHAPFPGIGQVKAMDEGYAWQPMEAIT
jgi:glyoxylase-like metal-dependent hydrolase (beta-lactamase superfamily II)